MFKRVGYCLGIVVWLGVTSGLAQESADMILHNGKVLTIDEDFTVAEAVAIHDGKITAVGSNAEVLRQAGPNTVRIDLKGKTVVPGLIDTHSHVQSYAQRSYGAQLTSDQRRNYPINFRIVKTTDDVLNQIRKKGEEREEAS